MRAPGESPTHAMAVPQVEHPLAQVDADHLRIVVGIEGRALLNVVAA